VATLFPTFRGGELKQQFATRTPSPSLLFLLFSNIFQEASCFRLAMEWTPLRTATAGAVPDETCRKLPEICCIIRQFIARSGISNHTRGACVWSPSSAIFRFVVDLLDDELSLKQAACQDAVDPLYGMFCNSKI